VIYTQDDTQQAAAEASREGYEQSLSRADYGPITTDIRRAPDFYYAEEYHQQYLAKNPDGYCGIGGTGVRCNVG
jgi:peptide-methionine (S)-S-oxide reductase